MSEDNTLFDRLGGSEKLVKIIDETYARVLADPELKGFFESVPMERLRLMQFHFLAAAFDGPTDYSGAELTAAHAGKGIGSNEFSRFCGHFLETLNAMKVDRDDINQALGRLATFKDKVTGEANVDG